MNKNTELLTAGELARHLRVRPSTIRLWARNGRIPKVQVSPKVVRFELPAVLAVARRRERGGQP